MKSLYILLLFGILFLASSCERINPEEDVPTHLHISSINFDAEPLQGTDSAEISDAWVYLDGELVGAFEMPFTAPILTSSGLHRVDIRPGVILNGIAATRTINPFFSTYAMDVDFEVGETDTIYPSSNYTNGLDFPWTTRGEEDFEEGGISIDSIKGSSTKIVKSAEDVYEGGYSGKIFLDQEHKTFAGQSTEEFDFSNYSGTPVMLEMHVKNPEIGLEIGMFVNRPGEAVVDVTHMMVTPGSDWKKLYINFTELVSYYGSGKYRVTFRAGLESKEPATIYLDNIKLVCIDES